MNVEIRTLFRVEGDESAKINTVAHYTLFSEDDNGEPKDVNVNNLDAWLRGRSNVRGRVLRTNVGTYSVEFVLASDPGVYHLDVTLDGRPIFKKGDIQLDVSESDPVRASLNFEFDGQGMSGGRVGDRMHIGVTVKDANGRGVEIDARGLQVTLQGPRQVRAQIGVEYPGKYIASFVIDQAGEFSIQVMYDNRTVMEKDGVRFSNRTNPSNSVVTSFPQRVRNNTEVRFDITSKDSQGARVWIGGDDWESSASGPERVSKLQIQDNDNGTYTVTTLFPQPGDYTFDVRCQGIPVANGPFKIRVD